MNMEREVIVEELKRTRGNMAQAARSLGITERMIGLRVEKYKIDTASVQVSPGLPAREVQP